MFIGISLALIQNTGGGGLGAPLFDWDFTTTDPATYGFTNVRNASFYDIRADGNFGVVANDDFNWPCYDKDGNNLGLGMYPSYAQNVRENSGQGVVVGSAITLVTNGNFALDPKHASINTVQNGWQWSVNGGSGSVVWNGSDAVTLTGDGAAAARLTTGPLTTVIGQTYTLTIDITETTSSVLVGTSNGGSQILSTTSLVGTRQIFKFVATTTTTFVSFQHSQATASVIRNASVQAGSLPNLWTTNRGCANAGTMTAAVVGHRQQNGIDVVSIRFSGTTTGAGQFALGFGARNNSNASEDQDWHVQSFLQQAAGSQTNISSIGLGVNEIDTATDYLATAQDDVTVGSSGDYRDAKAIVVVTTANASIAYAQPCIFINYSGAGAVDVTIDIGWPMASPFNDNRFRPPIRSTGSTVSVQTDNVKLLSDELENCEAIVVQCEWLIPALNTVNNGFHPIPIALSDGVDNTRWSLSCSAGFGIPGAGIQITDNGVLELSIDGGITYPLDGEFKCQAAYIGIDKGMVCIDGGVYGVSLTPPAYDAGGVGVIEAVTLPKAFSEIFLGRLRNGSDPFFGYLRKMKVWKVDAGSVHSSMVRHLSRGM